MEIFKYKYYNGTNVIETKCPYYNEVKIGGVCCRDCGNFVSRNALAQLVTCIGPRKETSNLLVSREQQMVSMTLEKTFYRCPASGCSGKLEKHFKYCPSCGKKLEWVD